MRLVVSEGEERELAGSWEQEDRMEEESAEM